MPHGTYGRVAPRSGLAAKHFIDTGAGVIDEDYRGNVMVLLFNHSSTDFAGGCGTPTKCGGWVKVMVSGVVDEDYRGNVMVLLFNHSNADFAGGCGRKVWNVIGDRLSGTCDDLAAHPL